MRRTRSDIGLLHHRRRIRKRRRRRLLWNFDGLLPDYTASHCEADILIVTAMICSNQAVMKLTVQ